MTPRLYFLLWLRRWHGRIGVAAAAFFVFMASTGIILNHTAKLRFSAHRVHAPWLAHWYGLKTEHPTRGFAEKGKLLVAANGAWLLGTKVIAENSAQPLGMVEAGGILYVATVEQLYLYSVDGALVDKVSRSLLPALPIIGIGSAQSHLMLQTASGVYSSADGLDWKMASPQGVAWSQTVAIPASEQARIEDQLSPSISAETLLLDVHSGRILGAWGPLFVDLIALVLIILAISGAVVFLRSHRQHAYRARTSRR